jgi:hypothetical protein
MNFEELYSVLNKRGFFNTFLVIAEFENYEAEKGAFYRRLTEFSHYNSFLRIKDKLLKIKLIDLEKRNGAKYIKLTDKGKTVYDNLLELNNLIKEEN